MPGSILGNAVVRVEDPALLTGSGTFVDNLRIPGVLHLAFVRSTVAHGLIEGIDVDEARAMPGVVAVYTHADIGVPPQKAAISLNDLCLRPPLADSKVRFAGEPVAVVVALSKAAGADAAEAVVVDYRPLDPVVDAEAALRADAPVQFDEIGSNLVAGFRDPADDGLAGADVVIRGRFENQRVAAVPMEGNAIAVTGPDVDGHELTVYVSNQVPHSFARAVRAVFGLEESQLRLVAPHVGGAFGAKAAMLSEHIVAVAAARKLGRPVKWVETRSENLLAMPHGRSQIQYVEMGFRRDGTIVGMHCRMIGDAGPTAASGAGWRWARPGRWPRASTGSRRSRTTSPSRSPTPPRSGRSGGPAGPRRPPSSSGSWTWPPTSSGSTRRSSGA
jgi:carbon-monoxide dehydrogenase large subunit